MEKNILRIAIQKSGRLSEDSLQLIRECGIKFYNGAAGKLKSESTNFPAELLFLRDDDIPQYVEDGVADIGIIGENVFVETKTRAVITKRLGFSKCRLSLAVPRAFEFKEIQDFQGMKIATSYPNLLNAYFEKNGIKADIHIISGSVEIAPGIGLADAICDIVSSGSTLLSNGLKEVQTIFESEAIMISRPDMSAKKEAILKKLLFRLESVQRAKGNRYILLNAPNTAIQDIINILPGIKSPTILPLAEPGWSSLHSVIGEEEFWDIIENLKSAGAEGILVVPIEKMIA